MISVSQSPERATATRGRVPLVLIYDLKRYSLNCRVISIKINELYFKIFFNFTGGNFGNNEKIIRIPDDLEETQTRYPLNESSMPHH
jgi:hypothetical protein